jgi:tetratricopeptide (TPR) repeat protein
MGAAMSWFRAPGRRSGRKGLYPHHGAAALAGEAILRFQPVPGADRYRIEVQDGQGHVVFETETATSEVRLVAGALEPGVRYRWTVCTVERAGPVAQGEAELATLPRDVAEAREALRKGIEAAGDGDSLALLAAVDRSLGLLAEAREELRTALQSSPEDAALAEALAELERRLAGMP